MPSKGALTLAKFNLASATSNLAWALASLALNSATSFGEIPFFLANVSE